MLAAANDNFCGASIRFPVEPRYVPPVKAARRLHLTASEFTAKLEALQDDGFPAPCPITGHFDLKAIDSWMDARAGMSTQQPGSSAPNVVMERLAAYG